MCNIRQIYKHTYHNEIKYILKQLSALIPSRDELHSCIENKKKGMLIDFYLFHAYI